jgi:hypothetical protein
MALPIWNSYAVRPLGFGGMALFCAWVLPASSLPADAILEVLAKVGPTEAATPADLGSAAVSVPLGKNAEAWEKGLSSGPCVVSWFARTAAGWQKGPAVAADLSPTWTSEFAYVKPWVIETLQQLEGETLPLGADEHVSIRGAYPRDTFPPPCISVSFEAAPQGQKLIGDHAKTLSPTRVQERQPWNVTISMVLWSLTPEERDLLAPWFLQSMQALSYLAPYNNLAEPSFNINESEDFSGALMEKPLFMITCSLSGIMWSSLNLPTRNFQGHLTI